MNLLKPGKTIDWSLVIIINLMWATQVPVIRLIGDKLSSVTVAFVPLIVSTLIFVPVLMIENRKRGVKMRWRWHEIRYFMLPGLIGIFLMQYAYTVGSRLTLAANAGIITLTIPVLVAIFASFMLNEKLNVVRILSFLLAIGGVLMTSVSDISGADFTQNQYLAGNLIFLFACACCGFSNTYFKMLVNKKFTELEILAYCSIIASIASIPVLIWMDPFDYQSFANSGAVALLGVLELSVIVYGVSMLLFFYVLKRMDVTQAVLGNYLLPFFIALLGVVLLHEQITWLMVTGGSLILISTLMVTVYETRLLSILNSSRTKKADALVNQK